MWHESFCLSQSLQNPLVSELQRQRNILHYVHMPFYNYLQRQTKIFWGIPLMPYLQFSNLFQIIFSCLANISVGRTEPSFSVKMSHHLSTLKMITIGLIIPIGCHNHFKSSISIQNLDHPYSQVCPADGYSGSSRLQLSCLMRLGTSTCRLCSNVIFSTF